MSAIKSKISTSSPDFKARSDSYRKILDEFNSAKELAAHPESEKSLQKLKAKNKLPTQERIDTLSDPGAPFLEVGELAGLNVYDGVPPGAGVKAGITKVSGIDTMVIANNPCIKGGSYFPLTVKKHLRAQEIAEQNKLPCVYLVDCGGAYLPLQSEVFPDKEHFGRIFYNQAQMSAKGIPQIACVLGSCTAGGAYVPAMSDEAIMVEGNASIFLAGPPLVKAATGEDVTSEELGGADVHCNISGLCDHRASNELEALEITRQILASRGDANIKRLQPESASRPPAYDPVEIYGVVGDDLRKSFDMKEVLARLLDDSYFDEFKENYGKSILCGFGLIEGFRVGIIANNGILFSESALKATHFIQLCEKRNIPLLFLQNVAGFMVGQKFEAGGIAKNGAKMVTAVATSKVPKFTLLVGGSFGAGNYGMCGRAYGARFLFTWPNSKISVMGGEQAASVLKTVSKSKKDEKEIIAGYEKESTSFYATGRLWDDGIIDPIDTRRQLALAFSATAFEAGQEANYGLFRM